MVLCIHDRPMSYTLAQYLLVLILHRCHEPGGSIVSVVDYRSRSCDLNLAPTFSYTFFPTFFYAKSIKNLMIIMSV